MLSVPVWVLVSTLGVWAASDPEVEAPPTEKTESGPKPPPKLEITQPQTSVQQLFDLDLRRWPEERFYENLTGLINELSVRYGAEATAVLLDTAELFLGQMMVAEAESVLEGLDVVVSGQARRKTALVHAQQLLGGDPVEAFETSPLSEENRPDRAFWSVLQAINTADGRMLNDNLSDGVIGLMHQTRPIAREVLPIIIEAMIETEKLVLADRSLELLESFPDLNDAPMGHYLRGRAAEKRRNQKTALVHYFEAIKGYDRYAVRSRIAIADMAMKDGGRGALMAAEDVLENGLDAWRGDLFEIATLEKLTEVYDIAEERVESLILLSKITMRFPGTAAAERAEVRSSDALRAVYQDGFDGKIPLSRWLSVHLRLVPAFRYHPEYAQLVEELADHLMELGGTNMAAKEYQRALEFRLDLIEMNGSLVTVADIDRNKLKLARAFATGGQYTEAKAAIAALDDTTDIVLRNQINRLRAKVAAHIGDTDALLRTHVMSPSEDNLRNVSHALWEKQDWVQANEFYNRLWAEYPESFALSDATYLLIAAHRSGDRNTATRVVEAFPDMTASQNWVRLAESFLTQPPDVSTLTRDAADERLDRLSNALSNIEGNGL